MPPNYVKQAKGIWLVEQRMVGGIKMKQRVANTSRYASLAHQARCCCLFLRIGAQAHDSRELTRAMESVANGGLAPAGVASMRHDYDANWPRVALGIILVMWSPETVAFRIEHAISVALV